MAAFARYRYLTSNTSRLFAPTCRHPSFSNNRRMNHLMSYGVADCTLKEWFLMSGRNNTGIANDHESNCSNNNNDTTTTTTTAITTKVVPPRILLLDCGVSTHLEEKIRQCSRCCNTATAINNDEKVKKVVDDVFPYRELWSSTSSLIYMQNIVIRF